MWMGKYILFKVGSKYVDSVLCDHVGKMVENKDFCGVLSILSPEAHCCVVPDFLMLPKMAVLSWYKILLQNHKSSSSVLPRMPFFFFPLGLCQHWRH